jgi:hypothetical protein
VVIVPQEATSGLLEKGYKPGHRAPGSNLQLLMRYLTRRLLQLDGTKSPVSILKQLETLLTTWGLHESAGIYGGERGPAKESETLLEIGKAAVKLGHYDFFQKFAQLHRGALPVDFFVWLRRWLIGGDDGGSEIQKRLQHIVKG